MKQVEVEDRIRRALSEQAERGAPTKAEIRARVTARAAVSVRQVTTRGAGPRSRAWEGATILIVAGAVVVTLLAVNLGLGGNRQPGPASSSPPALPTDSQQADTGIVNPVTVGRGRVAVDVPGDWSRGEVQCGVALSNTVVFESTGSRACFSRPTEFSTLTIGSATGHEAPQGVERKSLRGTGILVGQAQREDGFTVIEILVAEEDAWLSIRSRDAGLAQQIRDSLQLLPESETTVPDLYLGATGGRPGFSAAPGPDEVEQRLKQAGLNGRVRFAGAAGPNNWSSLVPDAERGSVVPVGSTVTVTYSVGTKRG